MLCIQLVIGFIACRMLFHFMYFIRNDEIKMFNQSFIHVLVLRNTVVQLRKSFDD